MSAAQAVLLCAALLFFASRRSRARAPATEPKTFGDWADLARCQLVSSYGLMGACDVRPAEPRSSATRLYLEGVDARSVPADALVYAPTSALAALPRWLDRLAHPIVLVTGDADEPADSALAHIAEHPRVRAWWAQNATLRHAKVRPLPIGLDYHTVAVRAAWGAPRAPPSAQEALLLEIARAAPPLAERALRAHASFHFNVHGGYETRDRRDALARLPAEAVEYERAPLPRAECWRRMAQFAFVASPHGHGLDCHRTWEALALGCVPIVKSSPLDALYERAGAMIVRDWAEATEARMRAFLAARRAVDLRVLQMSYWREALRAV